MKNLLLLIALIAGGYFYLQHNSNPHEELISDWMENLETAVDTMHSIHDNESAKEADNKLKELRAELKEIMVEIKDLEPLNLEEQNEITENLQSQHGDIEQKFKELRSKDRARFKNGDLTPDVVLSLTGSLTGYFAEIATSEKIMESKFPGMNNKLKSKR